MYSQDVGETFGWEAPDAPTYKDFIRNGMYCTTGLAYPISKFEARCARFKEMKFDGRTLAEPFECNPSDPTKKCQLYIEINEDD